MAGAANPKALSLVIHSSCGTCIVGCAGIFGAESREGAIACEGSMMGWTARVVAARSWTLHRRRCALRRLRVGLQDAQGAGSRRAVEELCAAGADSASLRAQLPVAGVAWVGRRGNGRLSEAQEGDCRHQNRWLGALLCG
jgi:hypothetical protein